MAKYTRKQTNALFEVLYSLHLDHEENKKAGKGDEWNPPKPVKGRKDRITLKKAGEPYLETFFEKAYALKDGRSKMFNPKTFNEKSLKSKAKTICGHFERETGHKLRVPQPKPIPKVEKVKFDHKANYLEIMNRVKETRAPKPEKKK